MVGLSHHPVVWIGFGLILIIMLPFYLAQRRADRRLEREAARAREKGLHEPGTIHPVVDTELCIGIGNCLRVCPEGEVIGMRDGQACAIAPAKCIGHGLCERACPVDAIRLVFGTAERGVELPRITERFETNVPGIYVIGELGGMGLIRNAFEQGRQCVDAIHRAGGRTAPDMLDVVIVGCGPAGLSASLNCLHRGLRFATIEREDVGGTVRHYPRKKLVMTQPVRIPGYGRMSAREIQKEDLIGIWEDVVRKTGLEVRTGEAVDRIDPLSGGGFEVTSSREVYRARRVILAIGRRGVPRKLGVPGEDRAKVIYSLREPEEFREDRVLVVGGGDSAVEAATALAEQPGTDVTISYRRNAFSRIKEGNRDRIERAIAQRRTQVLWSTNLVAIEDDHVRYRTSEGEVRELANDVVAVFAGGELPTKFLRNCGIEIDTKFGDPL